MPSTVAQGSRQVSRIAPTRSDAGEVLDWLVVGGGIHGCHLAARLLQSRPDTDFKLRVLDPASRPVARWRELTHRVGMQFLRSPVVHHIGGDSMNLARFGPTGRDDDRRRFFRGPYRRPALSLFNEHADAVTRSAGILDRWIQGRAQRLRRGPGESWEVEWDTGVARARNVLLALGDGDRLAMPEWARQLARQAGPGTVVHALDGEAVLATAGSLEPSELPDVVVGAGMTGAQLALHLANGGRPVCLISRRPLRVARYDTAPGWLGPRYMNDFLRESSPEERRRMIRSARQRGTVTDDVRRSVLAAQQRGHITHLVGEVLGAAVQRRGLLMTVREKNASGASSPGLPRILRAARVILATGVDDRRPGGSWIDEASARESLPVSACGYPLPDGSLRWAPGLFVSGPLADLELGPVARNIAGARNAADRIVTRKRAGA